MRRGKVKLTSGTLVGTASAVGLLDGEASTKGTSNGIVAAADSANVSGGRSEAVELLGHLDVDGEILLLGLGETERAGDVVGNLQWRESGDGVASLVHVALERPSAIGIDLVDSDCYCGAGRDLGHAASC